MFQNAGKSLLTDDVDSVNCGTGNSIPEMRMLTLYVNEFVLNTFYSRS